jgi:hypothetical protein
VTVLAIIAVVISIVAGIVAYLSFLASKRSADAAESAERRERTPRLSITLAGPPDEGDRAIYRVRNDWPVDLDDLTIARPRPPDGIEYHLAVTGSGAGWEDDKISLGAIALTQEASFTLSCGNSPSLPDFHLRIECRAGTEQWTLVKQLPSPRPPGLTAEQKAEYKRVLTLALDELTADIAALREQDWHTAVVRAEQFELARLLMVEHAPGWSGPVRDARSEIDRFVAWRAGPPSRLEADAAKRVGELSTRLTEAHASLRELRDALETRQASGMRWHS